MIKEEEEELEGEEDQRKADQCAKVPAVPVSATVRHPASVVIDIIRRLLKPVLPRRQPLKVHDSFNEEMKNPEKLGENDRERENDEIEKKKTIAIEKERERKRNRLRATAVSQQIIHIYSDQQARNLLFNHTLGLILCYLLTAFADRAYHRHSPCRIFGDKLARLNIYFVKSFFVSLYDF